MCFMPCYIARLVQLNKSTVKLRKLCFSKQNSVSSDSKSNSNSIISHRHFYCLSYIYDVRFFGKQVHNSAPHFMSTLNSEP